MVIRTVRTVRTVRTILKWLHSLKQRARNVGLVVRGDKGVVYLMFHYTCKLRGT